MRTARKTTTRWLGVALAAALLTATAAPAHAEQGGGGIFESFVDVLLMRPISIAATAVGSVLFAVSYPITYLADGTEGAQQALVTTPFENAFTRSLGTW